jgi:hypothetical protein
MTPQDNREAADRRVKTPRAPRKPANPAAPARNLRIVGPKEPTVVTVTAADLAALNPEIEADAPAETIAEPAAAYTPNPAIAAALQAEAYTGTEAAPAATAPQDQPAELAAGSMTTTDALENAHEAARLEFLAERISRGRYYQAVKALRGAYRDLANPAERAAKFETLRVISEAAYAEVLGHGNGTAAGPARSKQADLVAKLTAKIAANEAANAKLKADLAALVGTLNHQSGVPV